MVIHSNTPQIVLARLTFNVTVFR